MTDTEPLMLFDADRPLVRAAGVRAPRRLSFSQLSAFTQCPGRWLASRLLDVPPDWQSPLVLGSLAHGALEAAVHESPQVNAPDWRVEVERGVERIRARIRRRGWGDDPLPEGVTRPDGSVVTATDWMDAAAGRLDGFELDMALGRPPVPAATERHVEGVIQGVPVSGEVDYLDRSGDVVDWKTGRVPSRRDGKRAHADQLRVYRMLLGDEGVPVASAADVYVTAGGTRVEADLSRDALESTARWVGQTGQAIGRACEARVFDLNPSPLCPWCPLARVCPVVRVSGARGRETAGCQPFAPSDPRFAVGRLSGTHDTDISDGKEPRMADMDELMAMMSGETPAPKPKPKAKPADPWASEAGQAALDKWGVGEPEATPKEEPKAEPKEEPKVAPKPEPKPATPRWRPSDGRPYDAPVIKGSLNTASYAVTHLELTAAHAWRYAAEHSCDPHETLIVWLKAQWAVAQCAWPELNPPVKGLAEGHPDPAGLLDWAQHVFVRDADRALRDLLDADSTSRPGAATGRQALDCVTDAARRAGESMQAVRALLA
ncbi:PD-(D/E)XK nuclease family protein [Bifidobacterium thermophilum]|uniref:PD-(D/E)XK nuclease family protein n=1 Tax=Bifidobacterium thermophilum TaxID=33905 RepID=UPI0015D5E090|nr:PD-(D/E)XK nuclease family protein [Bifidobacterium thermophilum]